MPKPHYAFIIDTQQYAGNFERNLCAYITGIVGDCNVGHKMMNTFSHSIIHKEWFEKNILQKKDYSAEAKCNRPCDIFYNNGQYNSVVIFMKNIPTLEVLEEIKKRAHDYSTHLKTIYTQSRTHFDFSTFQGGENTKENFGILDIVDFRLFEIPTSKLFNKSLSNSFIPVDFNSIVDKR